jgi:hypothetical protein
MGRVSLVAKLMNERHAQFLILLADVCAGAELADLSLEVQTTQGTTIGGVPQPKSSGHHVGDVDHTGYDHTMHIGAIEVDLQDVVKFTVTAPKLAWSWRPD